ncbi:mechanosensitive ion channel [Marinobacter nanhaiticus D15-8W]|uniref:Small-conductance mechanosensitive channel n=1 Tax=Marinobacter nanhaiticus D15-8W TaxID=626887 RepID=N6WNS0_9GAMM|nr:mechanosensitive ion channel domain-containing protein [Marinobacter nanhaiticus]ENO13166.1 mechanosensitive ion channel family protein [Marinobacter nanhaiticus D15-8W]BES70526.1 mechanosensitive ion channel [Marinobacter nanhaiticus D15-8W]
MGDLGLKDALQAITSTAVIEAIVLVLACWGLILLIQWVVPRVAGRFSGKSRLYILAVAPLLRLVIIIGAIILVVPVLVEPTFENLIAIFGALALALGFAFKDYANSLIAGIVTLYEMPYRPGDWIEVDGQYGEVRSIGTRAATIVTPDDNAVVIPHGKLWDNLIANGNGGTSNLMCVVEFYLEPEHDAAEVRACLRDVAYTSPWTKTYQPVVVVLSEKPWGTCYRVKAYPVEPRDQFQFISDLTVRGKAALRQLNVRQVTAPVSVN